MGSNVVGVFDTTELENDTFVPDAGDHIPVSGGGPTGLVLDEARDRLYVLTRFNNAVATIELSTKTEIDSTALHNPEPARVVTGRRFLYDATLTTTNGESPCGSCHVFGDFDSLAWDLGNPDGLGREQHQPLPREQPVRPESAEVPSDEGPDDDPEPARDGEPRPAALARRSAPRERRVGRRRSPSRHSTWPSKRLLGRDAPLTTTEMQQFTDFALEITYPPNPLRALDDSLTDAEASGRDIFFNRSPIDTFQTCNGCHVLDPAHGHFGSDGFSSFDVEPQLFKIPHLRNLYQKVGMYGMAYSFFFDQGDNGFKGPSVRGFGFTHDGSADTLFRFMHAIAFDERPAPVLQRRLSAEPGGRRHAARRGGVPPRVRQQPEARSSARR